MMMMMMMMSKKSLAIYRVLVILLPPGLKFENSTLFSKRVFMSSCIFYKKTAIFFLMHH